MVLFICRALAIAIPALLLLPQIASAENKLDPEVETILRQRLAALRDVAKLTREQFQTGVVTFALVSDAETKLGQAELELVFTAADRIRVRENLLKTAEDLERVLAPHVENGRLSQTELFVAKAATLRARADLLLEKQAAPR